MTWIAILLPTLPVIWAVTRFHLGGEDLRRFDLPVFPAVNNVPSTGNGQVLAFVSELTRAAAAEKGRAGLARVRAAMNRLGEQADLAGIEVTPAVVAGRPAEWLTPAGGKPRGRLLYLHGGAFTMGSPMSHRGITTNLVRRTGLAVLALDYRLMPEHSRSAGIEDCRNAYRWLAMHGPDGPDPRGPLFVAGDSAGGNLTLMLIAWVRDQRRAGAADLRPPDGAITLSPLTDATYQSPSLRANVATDPILGAMAKVILRVPRPVRLWFSWLRNGIAPADPRVSPLRGDLSGLPPVLVQASEAEILIDDARRYVNKARCAGSPAEIETWHGMVHVWPAFGPALPETEQALERMATFVARVLQSRGQTDAA